MLSRSHLAAVAVAVVATLLYYVFIASGVLAALSLAIPVASSAPLQSVAVGWVLAETVVVILPFVALALVAWWWPSLLPRSIWLAPLGVVAVPLVLSALWNLWAVGVLRSDFAIGGGLAYEITLAVDIVAMLLGSALVIVVQSRSALGGARRLAAARVTGGAMRREGWR